MENVDYSGLYDNYFKKFDSYDYTRSEESILESVGRNNVPNYDDYRRMDINSPWFNFERSLKDGKIKILKKPRSTFGWFLGEESTTKDDIQFTFDEYFGQRKNLEEFKRKNLEELKRKKEAEKPQPVKRKKFSVVPLKKQTWSEWLGYSQEKKTNIDEEIRLRNEREEEEFRLRKVREEEIQKYKIEYFRDKNKDITYIHNNLISQFAGEIKGDKSVLLPNYEPMVDNSDFLAIRKRFSSSKEARNFLIQRARENYNEIKNYYNEKIKNYKYLSADRKQKLIDEEKRSTKF